MAETEKVSGMSSAAVHAKTGKTWDEWFAILDEAGGREMNHPQIVSVLREQGVSDWWQQAITVGYEQARGMRDVHQKEDGYTASASKTVNVAVERLFEAWINDAELHRWLPTGEFKVRKATPNKSLRIDWQDGSRVDVEFYDKGTTKSQVAVQQSRLPHSETSDAAKTFWGEALAKLKALVEQGEVPSVMPKDAAETETPQTGAPQ